MSKRNPKKGRPKQRNRGEEQRKNRKDQRRSQSSAPKRNQQERTSPSNNPTNKKKVVQTGSSKPVRKTSNNKRQPKRNTPLKAVRNIQPTDRISLVIPCYNEESRADLLVDGVRQFDQHWGAEYELIVVDDGSQDNTVEILQDKLATLTNTFNVEIIQLEQNQGKGGALKEGVARASGDFILTLDADMATSPMELKNWLARLDQNHFNENEVLIGSREHSDSQIEGRGRRIVGLMFNFVTQMMTSLTATDTQCGFKLYPANIGKQLFANMKVKGWAHDVELLYKAQLNGIEVTTMPVNWSHVEDSKIDVWKDGIMMVFTTIFTAWRIKWDWFVAQPISELTKKFQQGNEHSIYRLLFAVLTVALLVTMPMLSFDYGITGDEHAQKVYGELINEHFASGGDYVQEGGMYDGQNALTMKPNLWLYGGLFDYIAAKLYRTFGTEPYQTRHFFNAFIGFLLMFFTGLLGKEVSGSWKVGFLAMLLVALSPRIFGHSMNNPKDIPFATAYIFTILHIVRFVKQLPRPGAKTIIYLMIGIGASIGIRIGGLLLVAYLGLFTGVAFLWEQRLRKQLFSFNIPTIGRVAFYLALIIFGGFLLGIARWPFALQDPITNSMTALAEMSNFDYGIQMLYAGKHLWSDQLPWFYIPKWMIMTAPIAVLIGAILFAPVAFLQKNKYLLSLGILVFVGVFPIAYAIYQGSSLYDGMRHFLFAYPILVIMGAYGWGKLTAIIPNQIVGIASILLPVGLLALPVTWMFNNHPYQYAYINELYGGTKSAEATYETDYWMISAQQMCEWFAENVPDAQNEEVLVMTAKHTEAIKHYFKQYDIKARAIWQRYPQRDNKDNWEYGIFFNRFQNEGHLRSGAWPPYEVLHEEKVDGITVGVIVKKGNSLLGPARQLMNQGKLDSAIQLYNQEVQQYPKNELAWLNLADAYRMKGDFANMDKAANGALALSQSHVNTLSTKANRYYTEYEQTRTTAPNPTLLDSAIYYYAKTVEANYKFTTGYYYLAFCYANKNDQQNAIRNIELLGMNNGNIPQAFDLGIQMTQNDPLKQKYFQAQKALSQRNQQGYQQAYQLSKEIYRMNPKYEPGVKLKKFFDEQLAAQR